MIKLIKDGVSNHGSRHRQATRGAWRLWSVCCPPILQPFGAAPIYPGYKNPSTGNGKFIICHASKMINMVLQNFLIKNGGFENVQIKNGCSRIKTSDLSRNGHLPDFPAINLVSSKRGSGTPYTLRFYWENHIINYDSLIQLYHYQLRFNPSITKFCVTTLSLNPQLAVSGSNYDWLIVSWRMVICLNQPIPARSENTLVSPTYDESRSSPDDVQ